MVSDNFPYVNRRFLSVCVDGVKVMLKPFTVRANDVVSQGVALCPKGNRGFRNQENLCLWNPESHYILEARIQVPLTKTGIQYLESAIHGVESKLQEFVELLLEAKGD